MSETVTRRRPEEVVRQWQALAERRREYLLDLYYSGRWRRYYREDQMLAQMRESIRHIEQWTHLCEELEGKPHVAAPPIAGEDTDPR